MTKKILVLPSVDVPTMIDWWRIKEAVIERSYEELSSEFCYAIYHSRTEISLVVFERSVPLSTFVDFLTKPKSDFRGDVLFISDTDIFLSAMLSVEGRVLYRLSEQDLQFYISVQLHADSEAHAMTPADVRDNGSYGGASPFPTLA